MTAPFDTLKLARRFEAAGFDPKQAGDMAEAIAEATASADLATRADITAVRADMQAMELRLANQIDRMVIRVGRGEAGHLDVAAAVNFQRGLFRLWIVVSVAWTVIAGALLRVDYVRGDLQAWEYAAVVFSVPLVALILGAALLWVIRGFRAN
jgi:hypothetical protein